MSKSAVLGSHTSSRRDSWWYLEQDESGQLFVRYENDDDHSDDWRKPISEVLANGPDSARALLQERINRMFEDREANRT
jgi:hypothetical protein